MQRYVVVRFYAPGDVVPRKKVFTTLSAARDFAETALGATILAAR